MASRPAGRQADRSVACWLRWSAGACAGVMQTQPDERRQQVGTNKFRSGADSISGANLLPAH